MKDPYRILEISRDASNEEIKAAYLAKVRAYPPDRAPQEFQLIRGAFEKIDTVKKRIMFRLFDCELPDLDDLLSGHLTDHQPAYTAKAIQELLAGAATKIKFIESDGNLER